MLIFIFTNVPPFGLIDSSRCQVEETRVTPVTSLPTSSRKRRRNTARSDATSDIMGAFLDLQRQQHAEHMEAEELRHRREMEMFGAMEERRQQENRNMFQQFLQMIQVYDLLTDPVVQYVTQFFGPAVVPCYDIVFLSGGLSDTVVTELSMLKPSLNL
ncbi:unnamed protein product [Arctogadus glacialis]